MNSDVHPAVAALVVAATLMAVAVWAWGSGAAAGFGGPAELRSGPDGHRFVQIQNYLVEHDAEGAYLRTHELDNLGVEVLLGGYAFFSNGDVLLRRGEDPRSFLDNFRAYKRETNRNSVVPEDAVSGLARCNLDTHSCEQFGPAGIDFKAAFSVYIDWPTDDVYISDTTRHLLRKYSSDGVEETAPVDGFKFPNQLMLHDGSLLVADTNHHVIRSLTPDSRAFAEPVEQHDVVPAEAEKAQQTWPSHFARVGEGWWVNNMQTGMDRGGIYVFDDNWQFVQRVDLPTDADPISILPVADTVWVSDWNNDIVYRFSRSGERLANLESAGLQSVLAASEQERRQYTIYSFSGSLVVLLLFVGLLVRTFAQGMNKSATPPSSANGLPDGSTDTDRLHLEPDGKTQQRIAAAIRLVLLLLVLGLFPLFFVFNVTEHPELVSKLIGPVAGLAAIIVLVLWINSANRGTSVTVDANTLTLIDHTGRRSSCPLRQVRYDNTAIATHDAVVILGRPQAQIYAQSDVEERLMPRLADAQRVGAIEMLKIQIQVQHPNGLVTVLALVGLLIFGLLQLSL